MVDVEMMASDPLINESREEEEEERVDNGGVVGLSMWNYITLTKYLSFCGILVLNDDIGSFIKGASFFKKRIIPLIIPIIFFISTIFQDLFCYGSISSCYGSSNHDLFSNVTYNSRTIFGWVGLIVAGSALHANMLNFARAGHLETLFNRVPNKSEYEVKVKRTITAWCGGYIALVLMVSIASTSFVVIKVTKSDCNAKHLVCLIPQLIQIVSGLSVVFTGVGLSYLMSVLVNLNVQFTQDRCVDLITSDNLRGQLLEYISLKERLKKLGKDTQIGNAVAFCGGCLCIFGSLWAFSEDYKDDDRDQPVIFSISLWMFLVSLFLTFLTIFSFSNVTHACDTLLENTREALGRYVVKRDNRAVSLNECFMMIASHQQRFGFEIMGILVHPEIVRAGAYAGITAGAAILKLAI